MNHLGCSLALRFIKSKVYSGQKFFDSNRQRIACLGSVEIKRHASPRGQRLICVQQPHPIWIKSFGFLCTVSGPPQGR
jgi:hypothetical protein